MCMLAIVLFSDGELCTGQGYQRRMKLHKEQCKGWAAFEGQLTVCAQMSVPRGAQHARTQGALPQLVQRVQRRLRFGGAQSAAQAHVGHDSLWEERASQRAARAAVREWLEQRVQRELRRSIELQSRRGLRRGSQSEQVEH
jgi:uncharacterized protein YggL (DUF469 family)